MNLNLDAETRLLGNCLQSFDWLNKVCETLDTHHFLCPENRQIFVLIKHLCENDQPVTLGSIMAQIESNEPLKAFLMRAYTIANVYDIPSELIAIVKDNFVRLTLHGFFKETSEALGNPSVQTPDLVRTVEDRLYSLTDDNITQTSYTVGGILSKPPFLAEIQERQQKALSGQTTFKGIPTHFYDLDNHLSGLSPGHLTIIGARPGVGKTTFLLNLIESMIIKSHKKCLVFSLEMTAKDLVEKLICIGADIPYTDLRLGKVATGLPFQSLVSAANAYQKRPDSLLIDEQPSLAIGKLRNRAYRAKRLHGIDAIFIDYLQLLRAPGQDARHLEIGEISRTLKEIAKTLQVPVIAAAQLNRETEKRESKKPVVSDLRESGQIEADADEIILLHRPDMYDAHDKPGLIQLHLLKNRFGPTGIIQMVFKKETGVFQNYTLKRNDDV